MHYTKKVYDALICQALQGLQSATNSDEMAQWTTTLTELRQRLVRWEVDQGPPQSIRKDSE